MFSGFINKCPSCHGAGITMGFKCRETICQSYRCKLHRNLHQIKPWFTTSKLIRYIVEHVVFLTVIAFLFSMLFLFHRHNSATYAAPIALFGTIFVALKYKLDRAAYKKSLFKERFTIFRILEEIRVAIPHSDDTSELKAKFDTVYRKSYFLFSQETYDFIDKFGKAIICHNSKKDDYDKIHNKEIDDANELLFSFTTEQDFAKKFPELKIDQY